MKKMLKKPTKDTVLLIVNAYDGEACVNGDLNKCNASGGQCPNVEVDLGGIFDMIGLFVGKGK